MATSPNATQITPPRVPIIDERTGAVSREWYRWFYSLYNIVGGGVGIIPVASGGTGLSAIPTNGQLLIGNGTGYTLNTLGVGAGISVTNGLGTITLANTGVLSNLAGTGISVSSATGNVIIANTGVLSFSGGATGLTPAAVTTGAITLAGTLAIANGGTNGAATPTTYGVAYGTGTAYAFTAAGTTGQILTATTGGAPTWSSTYAGTVTSVSFTGGLITVATATTTPSLTVAGTSGGVVYFSSASTWASSAALAANALVVGGGVGAAPTTITTGTGVVTALGVNTGIAGAFIVNGGALGTPSSGTVTNLTGTASININGTVGATTPTTGKFTNITGSANAVIEITDNTNAALRITQLGTGNALLVEDSTNPDASPFVIDAAGRVINGYTASLSIGIGGDLKTQLTGAAGASGQTMARFDNNATGARFQFLKSRNATPGSSTIVQNGDSLGTIAWYGDDGAADYASNGGILAAFIGANVDGTPGTNDMPGRLTFNTTADGASTTTERMRIDSAGYLQQLTAPILPYQGAPASKAAAATLTGAELVTGILNTTGTTYTITLPTGTNIEGALSWASNNVCLDWWVINTATGIITIGANGNTTLGGLTIATGVSAHFRIRRTATNTFTIYRLS